MSKKEKFNIGNTEVIIDPDLLVFNDLTLGKYIEREGGWFDHYGSMLALAERHLGLLEAKHEKLFGERFAEFKDVGGSDKLAEARAKSDDDVSECRKQIVDAKYRVGRLKGHLKAWDKNHDNAQSMGHMQRKQMDKLNASIMGKVAGVDVNEILSDAAAESMANAQYHDYTSSDEPQEPQGGSQEGTDMSALQW